MAFFAIIVGLVLLIKGGDWLLKSSVSLSLNLSIPKAVIGMTVVSFATSAPELIVSIQSAIAGYSDIALGNVVGSNIANLSFVLAITVIITPIAVPKSFFKTDWPMMMFSTLLFIGMIAFDNRLSSIEGLIMVLLLFSFIYYLLKKTPEGVIEAASDEFELLNRFNTIKYLIAGGFALWLGSETLVKGAVSLASEMGVSERIISISIISVGTSIPELSASIIAIIRKEKAISLGNLIGSNVFNILAVMGVTSIIKPIEVQDLNLISNDFVWMFLISILVLLLVFVPKDKRLNRLNGIILLGLYVYFIYGLLG
ncbi:calcium/sodium antiporter [Flavobacteriaceae bacterium]|jgi:cation:H+ antiporter|uniref:calcium/sodium antiporter n=1 Tax=Candidatus Arcticimaribacter forsetii TaxID=2820661 RepID=UPI002076E886|nr:calcium/sodium antiporter [Candidatus Arcticimaribacter forsetii]MDA8699100.1 calcium/sodium antiporter [Flavobacteriaceae bacterium]MDB2345650.1 calcium/sodium antiporter [Flavobacteriaceae bacterium]MDB4643537.1 calcium/sodium antiporter [Flavobacteriaceae bacterium]MDB4674801.1 calcium/sodium antiporter [Flavobacteriaceae bacterium]MDB4716857.1 calcium/sodium antiporter [Flavobacteriaceae bacterium]